MNFQSVTLFTPDGKVEKQPGDSVLATEITSLFNRKNKFSTLKLECVWSCSGKTTLLLDSMGAATIIEESFVGNSEVKTVKTDRFTDPKAASRAWIRFLIEHRTLD